ncbi:DUF1682-domain-containing protein [Cryphonectria parasitica EP155]|uniref:DUF1682-domain-containing protein n=1 Tax=Cryphonectria parasitica (strain ATCC 38755 / EP155) TaxID=660469 RepID=A0A9P4YD90_CRYP1|nr:DUF1682-domain-containing protein [Cryphonectria parasitica EP155]KAF3770520.1 DUF1682-domain-containing protein [Cryphonectria parasitica EP155]
MADVLKGLFGGSKSTAAPVATGDSDFADFAEASEPSPEPFVPPPGGATFGANAPAATARPYTKWYRIDERYTLNDFRAEGIILAAIIFIFTLHVIGSRLNRSRAKKWIRAHSKILASEFALVGFGDKAGPASEGDADLTNPDLALREKSLFEFATYATGRQNVAFLDAKLTLIRRFNPLMSVAEAGLSLFIDSFNMPQDLVEVTIYPFDGKENLLVPGVPGMAELRNKDAKSSYDGFVWAIVNKDRMKQVRDERFDVSLTFTKDHNKLPVWSTVMSESAEITNVLLTNELAKAVESAGELFDYLIVSDQPEDKPKTLEETSPRKRIFLKYRLPSDSNYAPLLPIFQHAIRLTDQLAKEAHFRPEVLRKVKGVRDDTVKQIQKASLEEKSEERNYEREKARKAKRDQELAALDAKGQKKYLEKEREKEQRKQQKRMTSRA